MRNKFVEPATDQKTLCHPRERGGPVAIFAPKPLDPRVRALLSGINFPNSPQLKKCSVTPAKAGVQRRSSHPNPWIPAFAGMTRRWVEIESHAPWSAAKAGSPTGFVHWQKISRTAVRFRGDDDPISSLAGFCCSGLAKFGRSPSRNVAHTKRPPRTRKPFFATKPFIAPRPRPPWA